MLIGLTPLCNVDTSDEWIGTPKFDFLMFALLYFFSTQSQVWYPASYNCARLVHFGLFKSSEMEHFYLGRLMVLSIQRLWMDIESSHILGRCHPILSPMLIHLGADFSQLWVTADINTEPTNADTVIVDFTCAIQDIAIFGISIHYFSKFNSPSRVTNCDVCFQVHNLACYFPRFVCDMHFKFSSSALLWHSYYSYSWFLSDTCLSCIELRAYYFYSFCTFLFFIVLCIRSAILLLCFPMH